MAVVPLSTFLGHPSGATTPAPSPPTGIVPLRTFLGGDGAAAQPLTRTPGVRATPPTIPGVNPMLADLSQARAGLGLAGTAGAVANLARPGTIPLQALGGLGAGTGALQLALALANSRQPAPARALQGAAGAANLGAGAIRMAPEMAKSVFGAAARPLSVGLSYAGPILGIGAGAYGLSEAQSDLQRGIGAGNIAANAIALAMLTNPATAPFAWIPPLVSGGGGILAGLFGKEDVPHEVREAREAQRDIGAGSPMIGDIQAAQTADELWARGLPWMSGYVGGSNTPAVAVNAYLPREFVEFGGGNTFENWAASNATDALGRVPVPYLFGNPNPTYPTVKPGSRVDVLRYLGEHPELLSATLQSGIAPELKSDFNAAVVQALRGQLPGTAPPAPSPVVAPPSPVVAAPSYEPLPWWAASWGDVVGPPQILPG